MTGLNERDIIAMKEFFDSSYMQKVETLLENAVFSSKMLNTLINDLLDLAKLESNTFTFHEEYFDLIQVVENAFNQVRYQANQKGILLKQSVQNRKNENQER